MLFLKQYGIIIKYDKKTTSKIYSKQTRRELIVAVTQKRDYRFLISSMDKLLDYALNFAVVYFCYLITRFLYPTLFTLTVMRAFILAALFCLITSFLYNYYNVYVPMRTQKPIYFLGRIFLVTLEVSAIAVLMILFKDNSPSRPYIAWLVIQDSLSLSLQLRSVSDTVSSISRTL